MICGNFVEVNNYYDFCMWHFVNLYERINVK